jgi:hypothetical protein
VFGRSDTLTDSERFYVSILEFLEDLEEKAEVNELINWWNWYGCYCYVFDDQLTLFFVAKYFLALSSVPKASPNKVRWQN